jgi:hypothetical protein
MDAVHVDQQHLMGLVRKLMFMLINNMLTGPVSKGKIATAGSHSGRPSALQQQGSKEGSRRIATRLSMCAGAARTSQYIT